MNEPKPIEAETRGGSCAPAPGSTSEVPDVLRTTIAGLIRDAWWRGFNAERPDDIDFIDEFVFADEALDAHWPNNQAEARREGH